MPIQLTPETLRALEDLGPGMVLLVFAGIIVVLLIVLSRGWLNNQSEDRKAQAEATNATIANQSELIKHIGTQSTALTKMADAMDRQGDAQEKSADAAVESNRLHKDGFEKVDTRLTSIERTQTDQTKILTNVRAEMVGVKSSLTSHDESYVSLASRMEQVIAKLDAFLSEAPRS